MKLSRLDRSFLKAITSDGYCDPFVRSYLPEVVKYTKREVKREKIAEFRKILDGHDRRLKLLGIS